MVQVLHLMSHPPDFQAARTAELIRKGVGPGVEFTVRMIGRGGRYRNVPHAAMGLRFGRGKLFDVVHAWDLPSLLAACGGPSPVVFSPTLPPANAPAWLAAAMVYRNGTAIATTPAMRRRLVRHGIPAMRCHVIPPAVDFDRLLQQRTESLRRELGIARDDRIILAPGESVREAGHLLALHVVSILHVLDPRARLLVMGTGPSTRAMVRLAARLNQPRVLVMPPPGSPIQFEDLLGAADLALLSATHLSPIVPMAMCIAAGIPVVAAATPENLDLLTDGVTASLVPQPTPRLLAQRILELFEAPEARASLSSSAKDQAIRRLNPAPLLASYLALYRRAAGIGSKANGRLESPDAIRAEIAQP